MRAYEMRLKTDPYYMYDSELHSWNCYPYLIHKIAKRQTHTYKNETFKCNFKHIIYCVWIKSKQWSTNAYICVIYSAYIYMYTTFYTYILWFQLSELARALTVVVNAFFFCRRMHYCQPAYDKLCRSIYEYSIQCDQFWIDL